jgi:CRP/FNR family cyclic AMP-dependent transcriptional regulator
VSVQNCSRTAVSQERHFGVLGRRLLCFRLSDSANTEGESPANAVFYIQREKIKLTVVANNGKQAVIAILGTGDFVGEGCLRTQRLCMATAT